MPKVPKVSERQPLTAWEALDVLALYLDLDQEPEVRESALNDDRVPDEIVSAWLRTLPGEQRQGALGRCSRPAVLDRWALSPYPEERVAVAFNPYTPPAALSVLVEDPDELVRCQIAFNPQAGPETLRTLFADPSPGVRESVDTAFSTEFGLRLRAGDRLAELTDDPEFDEDN